MRHLRVDLENLAESNENIRHVVFARRNSHVVVMALGPGNATGDSASNGDRFVYVVEGVGEIHLPFWAGKVRKYGAVCIPAGMVHNFVNTGDKEMKLFTVASPPECPARTIEAASAIASDTVLRAHSDLWGRGCGLFESSRQDEL